MKGPLFTVPATEFQIQRLRELATWPGLPQPEASEYAERRIEQGLTKDQAYDLIRAYGGRIQQLRADGGAE